MLAKTAARQVWSLACLGAASLKGVCSLFLSFSLGGFKLPPHWLGNDRSDFPSSLQMGLKKTKGFGLHSSYQTHDSLFRWSHTAGYQTHGCVHLIFSTLSGRSYCYLLINEKLMFREVSNSPSFIQVTRGGTAYISFL